MVYRTSALLLLAGLVASKVPLFLLAFSLLGIVALWRAPLSREMLALLLCTGVVAGLICSRCFLPKERGAEFVMRCL